MASAQVMRCGSPASTCGLRGAPTRQHQHCNKSRLHQNQEAAPCSKKQPLRSSGEEALCPCSCPCSCPHSHIRSTHSTMADPFHDGRPIPRWPTQSTMADPICNGRPWRLAPDVLPLSLRALGGAVAQAPPTEAHSGRRADQARGSTTGAQFDQLPLPLSLAPLALEERGVESSIACSRETSC